VQRTWRGSRAGAVRPRPGDEPQHKRDRRGSARDDANERRRRTKLLEQRTAHRDRAIRDHVDGRLTNPSPITIDQGRSPAGLILGAFVTVGASFSPCAAGGQSSAVAVRTVRTT